MIYFEKNEVIVSLRLLGMMNLKYAMDLGHKTNDQRVLDTLDNSSIEIQRGSLNYSGISRHSLMILFID